MPALDLVRTTLHQVLTTPKGDAFTPLRVQKDLARRFNMWIGSPICSKADLEKRRKAAARLKELRAQQAGPVKTAREAAPVMVYFEKDRNARELARIKDTLDAKSIAYTALDVFGDEATLDFVCRSASCESDDLPIVFVAGKAIGPYNALVRADVSGELAALVFGD